MKKTILLIIISVFTLCFSKENTIKGSGGPDTSGYYWIDSDETGGPAYSWVEISSVGQLLYMNDESMTDTLALGFNFEYYGNVYPNIMVCSNGYLSLTDTSPFYTQTSFPSTGSPDNIIAPFWTDLDPGSTGSVFYFSDAGNNRAIVQYQNIVEYGSSDTNTFQVILYSDGSIVYQYKEMNGDLENASVGLENADGTVGLQMTYNSPYLKDSLAVKIFPGVIVYGGDLSLSRLSIPFGSVDIGKNAVQSFTIYNQSTTQVMTGSIASFIGYSLSEFQSKNTLTFRINPNSEMNYVLEFNPVAEQSYTGYVVINSSDPENLTDSIYVSGEGVVPNISLSVSDTLKTRVYLGGTRNEHITVYNTGLGNLDYSSRISQLSKVTAKGSGGPDLSGYVWKDSDDPAGPVYQWFDITDEGTPLNLDDEGISPPLDMNFNFSFYGNIYSTVSVVSNGYLIFDSDEMQYENVGIPNAAVPNNMIAAYWRDLDPEVSGEIYYYYDSVFKRFIVQYEKIADFGSTNTNTFQAVLYSDGSIVLQYKEMNGETTSCTVGIENITGTTGLQVAYNTAFLKNNLAVEICNPSDKWLFLTPKRSSVSSNDSLEVTVNFDSSELPVGKYLANIYFDSNDPDTQTLTVPVVFDVYTLSVPSGLTTSSTSGKIYISWSAVPYATTYKVYSSNVPNGTFAVDTTGTFAGTTWSTDIVNAKKFYYVTSVDAKK